MADAVRLTVFGAAGQLGCALQRRAAAANVAFFGFDHRSDIREAREVEGAIAASKPDILINAAAYTAVDKAESDVEAAQSVNRDGAAVVAEVARQSRVPLIHISTDYVFDGTKAGPYREDDPISPMSVYGQTKADGESAVLDLYPQSLVARTAWVYGLEGNNFVKTMLRLGETREQISVVDDQRGSPTFADDLADALLLISARIAAGRETVQAGIYHMTGSGEATWCEFARAIFSLANQHGRRAVDVAAIGTKDYPTAARRPANSVLNCAKAEKAFGVRLPHWRDGLDRMLSQHLAKN
jgi:dTDP-4-dehydrorhamnose reductase